MHARVFKTDLKFISPGKTSRGVLYSKPSWFIQLENNGFTAMGECSVIPGLNKEFNDEYQPKIDKLITEINQGIDVNPDDLIDFPSIRFGLETAQKNLLQAKEGIIFPSKFTEGELGIPINGLIWMGDIPMMKKQIAEKLEKGFKVLKLKVGSLDLEEEINLLKSIRAEFKPPELELRLDANGAFSPVDAHGAMNRYADFTIHSIEQPIKAGQWDEMALLCYSSAIPIALDEDLIGMNTFEQKKALLNHIQPPYIILKPSLTGGFDSSNDWIRIAEHYDTRWWATSALESNVGLNAIAQWVFTRKPTMVQGLGTGQVFSNNIASPLKLKGTTLYYDPEEKWEFPNK